MDMGNSPLCYLEPLPMQPRNPFDPSNGVTKEKHHALPSHVRLSALQSSSSSSGVLTPWRLAVSGEQASSPYQWRGTVIQGGAIEIKGVNGAVKASAATGAEVEVSAVMRGQRSNPADVRIDVVQHGGGDHDLRGLSEPGLTAKLSASRRRRPNEHARQ